MTSGFEASKATGPSVLLGGDCRLFDFESDFAHDLRCIPMAVRFKLDRVGIKLSLRQWAKMGAESRRGLWTMLCDTDVEVAQYEARLVELVGAQGSAISRLPLEGDSVWASVDRVPALIVEQSKRSKVGAPTSEQWAGLSLLERFALVKLARSDHENENFAVALCEFGIQA